MNKRINIILFSSHPAQIWLKEKFVFKRNEILLFPAKTAKVHKVRIKRDTLRRPCRHAGQSGVKKNYPALSGAFKKNTYLLYI